MPETELWRRVTLAQQQCVATYAASAAIRRNVFRRRSNMGRLMQQAQYYVATCAGVDLSPSICRTWRDEVDVLDTLEAFLEVLLYCFGVPRLPQYL